MTKKETSAWDQVSGLVSLAQMLNYRAEELCGFARAICEEEEGFEIPPDYFTSLVIRIREKSFEVDALFPEDDGPPSSGGGQPAEVFQLKVVNG